MNWRGVRGSVAIIFWRDRTSNWEFELREPKMGGKRENGACSKRRGMIYFDVLKWV